MIKKILTISTFFLLIISCSNKSLSKAGVSKDIAPPGTQEVAPKTYADRSLMTNIDYKEYIYWMSRVYGETSETYLNALPDFTVWRTAPEKLKKYEHEYFKNSKFDDYSVVGISDSQINDFIKWRTDRVAQAILIGMGAVDMHADHNPTNHFTIERYLSGNYQWTKEQLSEIIVPIYSLPTDEEVKLYGPMVKTKFMKADRKESLSTTNQSSYQKGFWTVARYRKIVVGN